jgi:cell division protease FtsH
MSERLGFVFYGEDENRPGPFGDLGGGRDYSEETARAIDEEIKGLIDRLWKETTELLAANRERVDAMAKALLKYETLDTQDIDQIMRGESLTRPTVGEVLEKEKPRRTVIAPGTTPGEPEVRPGLGDGPLPAPG